MAGYKPNTPKVKVTLVSGEPLEVIGDLEASWWNKTKQNYLDQTKFTEITDRQDLDRLLSLELQIFRTSQQLAVSENLYGEPLETEEILKLQKTLREFSEQASRLKTEMQLSKKARDAAANDGNFAGWLEELKRRAKLFGIHRNNQVTRALALINELSAIVGTYDRSDEEERGKIGFPTENDIVAWVRETMIPEYHDIDEKWRASEQKMWTQD